MHAVGSCRQRDVSAVIDEHTCRGVPGPRDRPDDQAVEQRRIEAALANLDEVDTRLNRLVKNCFEAEDLVARRARIGID
jgi:hypothetical protein